MKRSLEERLFGNVERLPWSGCWIWMGYVNRKGYGALSSRTKRNRAEQTHRVAWEIANGCVVPAGMMICHSCDVPSCINSAHLWLGTNQQNLADAGAKGRLSSSNFNGMKTHCPKGHEYTPENTCDYASGRQCLACKRLRYKTDWWKAWNARRRAEYARATEKQSEERSDPIHRVVPVKA